MAVCRRRSKSLELPRTNSMSTCFNSDDEDTDDSSSDLPASPTPADTLIFLDWDDTLFPTTALKVEGLLPDSAELWEAVKFSREQKAKIWRWSAALSTYLSAACQHSARVVVISHALPGWVEQCVRRFAPHLEATLLRKLRVVYAPCRGLVDRRRSRPSIDRATDILDDEFMALLTASKHAAMWREAKKFFRHKPWGNIISIGDMPYEASAARDLGYRFSGEAGDHHLIKVLICPREPSIDTLIERLQQDASLLPAIVRHGSDLDMLTSQAARLFASPNDVWHVTNDSTMAGG